MDVILSGLGLLHEPDEIIEIRSIDPKPVISGYFRADSPAIAKELSRYPNRTFYQTMNRVKSACYARKARRRLRLRRCSFRPAASLRALNAPRRACPSQRLC